MASTGYVATTAYDGRYAQLNWSVSQSGNVSTINWNVELKGGNLNYYLTTRCYFTVSCTKGTPSISTQNILSYSTAEPERLLYKGEIGNGSFTITHNGSGEANFTIKLYVGIYYYGDPGYSGEKTWDLPTTTKNKVHILYYSNGGTPSKGGYKYGEYGWIVNSSNNKILQSIEQGSSTQLLKGIDTFGLTKTGYYPNGVWESISGDGYLTPQGKDFTEGVTYTAAQLNSGVSSQANSYLYLRPYWSPYVLTVIYDKQSGVTQGSNKIYTVPKSSTGNYGENYNTTGGLWNFSNFDYQKPGYSLGTNWASTTDGSGTLTDQSTQYTSQALASRYGLNLGTGNRTLTLYPTWIQNTYTFNYNANGGTGTMTASTVQWLGTINIKQGTFKKTGHKIKGWYVKRETDGAWYCGSDGWLTVPTTKRLYPNGNSTDYQFNSGWTTGLNGNETFTFYAVWEIYNTVRIYDGSTWRIAVPFIYDGTEWKETKPYIYDGSTWKESKG